MKNTTLNDWAYEAHLNSANHGFWNGAANQNIPTKLMLIVSELSEALEEFRDPERDINTTYYTLTGKPEGFGIEIADVLIRVFDLAEYLSIDLDAVVEEKMEYNKSRPAMHGKTI